MTLSKSKYLAMMVIVLSVVTFKIAAAQEDSEFHRGDRNGADVAKLYELQAAFHRAASVHDPVNGDSPEVITERVREMLSLWTRDAVLYLNVGGAVDGYYIGRGDPDDVSTCPAVSSDPSNRGTLCTLFNSLSGSFKPANKWISMAPSFDTSIDVHGHTGTLYFQCHYFNVAVDPGTGKPLWAAVSHVELRSSVRNVGDNWQFSYASASVPPLPVP